MTTIESKMNFLFAAILKAEADERESEALEFRAIAAKHEKAFKKVMVKIFKEQKNEVAAKLLAVKAIEDLFMFDTTAWKETTKKKAENSFKKAMNDNGIRVYRYLEEMEKTCKFVLISTTYDMEYPEALAYIEEQSERLSEIITEETERIFASIISQAFTEGLTMAQIADLITGSFDDDVRAMTIARTEIIRAANYGALSAYKQSGVVVSKEWLTAQDEKVCPHCGGLDGKIIGLDESYLPVGGTLVSTDRNGKEHTLTNNYLDTLAPPVHPRCRCTLLPVVKDI